VLDGIDGTIARLLKASSPLGAQLDSLSDFVSFGVAPAVLLYLWTMHDLHGLGWVLVLLFGVCCALRLARFNTQIGAERPSYAYNFFTGVPAPAAAGLVLTPVFFYFEFNFQLFRSPYLCGVALAGVAVLMVSRVPTYSIKPHNILWAVLRVPGGRGPLLMLAGLAALVAFFTTEPWATLLVIFAGYLASIPHSILPTAGCARPPSSSAPGCRATARRPRPGPPRACRDRPQPPEISAILTIPIPVRLDTPAARSARTARPPGNNVLPAMGRLG
jgi:CDP-diacylglycerol---serine O-phosphatidyltransferase